MKDASRFAWRSKVPPAGRVGVALILAATLSAASHAQSPRPALSVASSISAEPGTRAPLSIRIGPPESVPKGSFLRLRGLPPVIALSEGHSIAPGSWAIPIAALPDLKLIMPASAAGQSELTFTLVAVDGAVLAETKSTFVVAGAAQGRGRARSNTIPAAASILRAGTPDGPEQPLSSAPTTKPPTVSPQQHERALRLLKRGTEHLGEGGIAQARLLFERAAEAGLPQAAMALAATYDPIELERLAVHGLKPDPAEAQRWYQRARQLGATDAEQRLHRLGANSSQPRVR